MTNPHLPSSFKKVNAAGLEFANMLASMAPCLLQRVETVSTLDDDSFTETQTLLTFRRHNITTNGMVQNIHAAIMADIKFLNMEYEADAQRLSDHFSHGAEIEEDFASPFIDDSVNTAEAIYRLTVEDGQTFDLFRIKNLNNHYGADQVEMQIWKVLGLKPTQPPPNDPAALNL